MKKEPRRSTTLFYQFEKNDCLFQRSVIGRAEVEISNRSVVGVADDPQAVASLAFEKEVKSEIK